MNAVCEVPEDEKASDGDAILETECITPTGQDSFPESVSDEWDVVSMQPGNIELSVESALLWCLNPAIYGIKSIGVLPAAERARQLVRDCDGDTNAAVALASGGESGGAKRTRIIFEFLIRQVPLVGCPAFILTSTWTHLRSVAIIASIYGHDIETPRAQHEILWCLIPSNGEAENEDTPRVSGDAGPISATAKTVSNVLISTAVKKATGISMVSELFQLGTDLWAVSSRRDPGIEDDEDGFECITLGPSATARQYFCPESTFSIYKLALISIGVIVPFVYRLPVIFSTILMVFTLTVSITWAQFKSRYIPTGILNRLPKIVSHAVFAVHAALPVIGLTNGINLALTSMSLSSDPSSSDRISLVVMSLVSLSGAAKHLLSGPAAESAASIHESIKKIALIVGIVLHLLPMLDRSGLYVTRVAWLLSDTRLSSLNRSLSYMSVIVSSTCQQILFSQIKKREVLLRLLGAERVMVLSLTLFFRGITAAVTSDSLMPYFRQVSPHPLFCCLIMCARKYPVHLALLLSIVPRMPGWVWGPYAGHLVMLIGLAVGSIVVITVWNDWQINEDAYLSNMRMLYILPGTVAGKTKDVVDKMLLASGKSAMKKIFVNYVRKFIPNFRKAENLA